MEKWCRSNEARRKGRGGKRLKDDKRGVMRMTWRSGGSGRWIEGQRENGVEKWCWKNEARRKRKGRGEKRLRDDKGGVVRMTWRSDGSGRWIEGQRENEVKKWCKRSNEARGGEEGVREWRRDGRIT